MSNQPGQTPGADQDAFPVERLTGYLEMPPEMRERLQQLREQVTITLNNEFSIVSADLGQLRAILSDAATKLSGTFRVVTASSDELRRTLGEAGDDAGRDAIDRLRSIADAMASTAGATVQSLQFEDMAAQLLQHVDRKLAVLACLARDMAVLNPGPEAVPPSVGAARLDQLFETLAAYRMQLETATRKVVQQQSLESGDIELF